MKNALLLVIGVGVGFIAAHQFEKTPEGKRFFGEAGDAFRQFTDAVVDGYKTRESELRTPASTADAGNTETHTH
jgi:hypothetical protein